MQVHSGKSYKIQNAETSHSGNYECQTSTGEISDPARLNVSDEWLILQTPLYVYEGDEMKLRCHHYPAHFGRKTRFYKENKVITDGSADEEFHISNVDRTSAGKYKCTKEIYYILWSAHVAEASVSVEELFKTPTIKVTPRPVFKKENMTLKCETSLHPSRQNTRLLFAFYREGRIVQGFGDKDIYEVSMVQLEHSGKYSCEVQTTDGRVRKKSAEEPIQIEEQFSYPNITVTENLTAEGDAMTLTCDTTIHIKPTEVQFAFYRDGREVRGFNSSNKYEVQFAQQEDSGNYTCEVKNTINTTMKTSDRYNVWVEELFSPPVLKVSPELVNQGKNMILTCDTNLSEHRQTTELQYAFYRDGENIQGFNSSNRYEAKFMKVENSGTYTCEIQASNGSVKKRSKEVQIEVSYHSSLMIILPVSLGLLLLIVIISIFVFVYNKRRSFNNNPQPPTDADEYSDADNEYSDADKITYTNFAMTRGPQNDVPENNGSDVVYAVVNSKAKLQAKASQRMSDTSTDVYQNIGSNR
ncbi:Fc receptor-like protein 3 [Bufo gargarizans]|uniref:Fc receptor-like protein 3 n=1 Tax=Bufo gargarizans TaxID=30331 RepID=UPI001CF2EE93|nr:Fc receptor-like protein 3 [Bufo gargarizans]